MATAASRTWRRLMLALPATASLATPVDAQVLVRSPQQIAQCLCQNRVVDELKVVLDQQWRVSKRAGARFPALRGQGRALPRNTKLRRPGHNDAVATVLAQSGPAPP